MIKILLSIILTLILSVSHATIIDEPNYPIYQYDSANNKVAVIISLKQARMMDNDYDILELLAKAKTGCDSLATSYQIVIKSQDKTIATQDIKISELLKLDAKNKDIIKNLNEQIKKYIEDGIKSGEILINKDKELDLLRRDIVKLKIQKIAGFTTAGGITAVVIAGLVYGFVSGHLVIK